MTTTSTDDHAGSPLARAAARRHERTLQAATATIERLDRNAQTINFSVVAHQAGVSRAWLYRQPEIRDLIIELRTRRTRAPMTPAAQRATDDSLRQRLATATEEIRRLRNENTALREQLGRHLGVQRVHPNQAT
ncbi:MAG: transposase [Pseudonocardiales bacterium]|nr:MAG: transposase [Pseudonocardiales bacterium]